MKEITEVFKLSGSFFTRYIQEYILIFIKPFLAGVLGFVFFFLMFLDKKIVLIGLLSLPFFFYSFWRGIVINYSLNICASSFLKNEQKTLKQALIEVKQEENKLGLWVCFCCIINLLVYFIPLVLLGKIYIGKEIEFLFQFAVLFLLNAAFLALVLLQFSNFSYQVFYYRKKEENFFKLLINSYSKTGFKGFLIAFALSGLKSLIANFIPIAGLLAYIILNPFIVSFNNFYYYRKIKE